MYQNVLQTEGGMCLNSNIPSNYRCTANHLLTYEILLISLYQISIKNPKVNLFSLFYMQAVTQKHFVIKM